MRLYHFTCVCERHLGSILREGVLRTTDPNILPSAHPFTPGTGQPVVWLLDMPTLDAPHGLPDGTDYVFQGRTYSTHDKRAIRIAVDVPDARAWLQWLTVRRHDAAHVRTIIRAGGGNSAARHWYVVARPIPQTEWTEIRDMKGGQSIWPIPRG